VHPCKYSTCVNHSKNDKKGKKGGKGGNESGGLYIQCGRDCVVSYNGLEGGERSTNRVSSCPVAGKKAILFRACRRRLSEKKFLRVQPPEESSPKRGGKASDTRATGTDARNKKS